MRVRVDISGSAALIRVEGRLTVETETGVLDALVRAAFKAAVPAIILDLARVDRLDCCGIGHLVRIHNQVVASGRSFAIVNAAPRCQRLLQLAGLMDLFHPARGNAPVASVAHAQFRRAQ